MSERDDSLREMAANRGCRLARSRRRKPGGDHGRYGLKDAGTGREVFGFGSDGLTATPEEIEAFLRGGAASGWKTSLGTVPAREAEPRAAKQATKRSEPDRPRKEARTESPKRRPEPEPRKKRAEPRPPKAPAIREAAPRDAGAIAALVNALGYEVTAAEIRRRLDQLRKAKEPALVADSAGVVGCLTWHVTPVVHRPRPVGRVTMLVVAEKLRGGGIGTLLVEAAEARLRERGCGLIEVTSNMKRLRAHGFYQRLGFERTSYRFAKSLPG